MKLKLIVLIHGECKIMKFVTHLFTFWLNLGTSVLSFPLKNSVSRLSVSQMSMYSTKE